MDLTQLAVDAGQFINRAVQVKLNNIPNSSSFVLLFITGYPVISVQYTGETLGQADRTQLDSRLQELLTRAEATKTCTERIITQTEVLLQPNPGETLSNFLEIALLL